MLSLGRLLRVLLGLLSQLDCRERRAPSAPLVFIGGGEWEGQAPMVPSILSVQIRQPEMACIVTKLLQLSVTAQRIAGVQLFVRRVEDKCCVTAIF